MMPGAGDLPTAQVEMDPIKKWFFENPMVFTSPQPEVKKIAELQEIANKLLEASDSLSIGGDLLEDIDSQIHRDRLREVDDKILDVWGTTLEKGLKNYQTQGEVPKKSPWWSCFCCYSPESSEEVKENIKRSLDQLFYTLFQLNKKLYAKKSNEQQDSSFIFWKAHHIKYLVTRALEGASDMDKPCHFLKKEAVLQFGKRILEFGKRILVDKEQVKEEVILRPADLIYNRFVSCEEKICYKLLVYSHYLLADLKQNMEILSQRLCS